MTGPRRPRVLFHGSPVVLEPGAYLLPAATLGLDLGPRTLHQPHYSSAFVYLTEVERYARVFTRGIGAVYRVEPVGQLWRDPDARGAWRARRARILERVA